MVAFEIVAAINARMKELGYSQNRLARNMDISRTTLYGYLTGKRPMRLDAACEAMHWLGLDMAVVYKND